MMAPAIEKPRKTAKSLPGPVFVKLLLLLAFVPLLAEDLDGVGAAAEELEPVVGLADPVDDTVEGVFVVFVPPDTD